MLEVNKTYNMDCLDGLGEIEDNAIDLIIADPPYNIKKAGWDNLGGIDKAVEWQMKWIYKCCEKLKNQGVFYVFGGNINNFAALIEEIRNALPKLFLKSFIVWDKSDFYRRNVWKSENNNLRMYFNVCEYIIHFIKIENGSGKERVSAECVALFSGWYKKELQRLKLTAAEVKKTYSSATGKKPYMFSHYFTQTQFELPTLQVWEKVFYPLGFRYKRGASKEDFEAPRQNYEALRQDYEALRQDYEALRYYHNHQLNDASCNVFKDQNDANGKKRRLIHPTQKPLSIMQRLIRVSSRPGELILDPFAGSGAAALAALKEGRNFIAFEKDKRYFEKAETEINSAKALFLRAKTLKEEMRNERFTDF